MARDPYPSLSSGCHKAGHVLQFSTRRLGIADDRCSLPSARRDWLHLRWLPSVWHVGRGSQLRVEVASAKRRTEQCHRVEGGDRQKVVSRGAPGLGRRRRARAATPASDGGAAERPRRELEEEGGEEGSEKDEDDALGCKRDLRVLPREVAAARTRARESESVCARVLGGPGSGQASARRSAGGRRRKEGICGRPTSGPTRPTTPV